MRGVGAHAAPRPPRRASGQQVAADVARRQAEHAQRAGHHVGEVLADAAALLEGLGQRRVDLGAAALVVEVGVDALHQLHRAPRPAAGRGVNDCRA